MGLLACDHHHHRSPRQYTVPGEQTFPEGLVYQRPARAFFVSSSHTGAIYRAHLLDSVARPFLPAGSDGRTEAAGMKIAGDTLYIAGGSIQTVYAYQIADGTLLHSAKAPAVPAGDSSFLNDVAVLPSGRFFVTDSYSPAIYEGKIGQDSLRVWKSLRNSPITYQAGFNLNGLVATPDNLYLLAVQTNTGQLFRFSLADGSVQEVALGGKTLLHGDGMFLEGHHLYVAQNKSKQVTEVVLGPNYAEGKVGSHIYSKDLAFPTAVASTGATLLVVNAQLDKAAPGAVPQLPFTVSGLPIGDHHH